MFEAFPTTNMVHETRASSTAKMTGEALPSRQPPSLRPGDSLRPASSLSRFFWEPPTPLEEFTPINNLTRPAMVTEAGTLPDELLDADRQTLSRDALLAVFPSSTAWRGAHSAALTSSKIHRQGILARVAYLSALKNTVVPELSVRSNTIDHATYSGLSTRGLQNHHDWAVYLSDLPSLISDAIKHTNWLKLLERDYQTVEPIWGAFWEAHARSQAQQAPFRNFHIHSEPSLREQATCMRIAHYNKRRLFLQERIRQGRDVVARLYADPPDWMEWRRRAIDEDEAGETQNQNQDTDEDQAGDEDDDGDDFEL